MRGVPLYAFVTLQDGKAGRSWVIPHCPLCGQEHWHGAGESDEDPARYLGSRVVHCSRGRFWSYHLTTNIELNGKEVQ